MTTQSSGASGGLISPRGCRQSLRVTCYSANDADVWDTFVERQACNGTVFHSRRFLSYHPPERFIDASTLVWDGQRLAAVMPVSRRSGKLFSHAGSTYGGPVLHPAYLKAERLAAVLHALESHYGVLPPMRLPEPVFFEHKLDTLLYFLHRKHRLSLELGAYCPVAGMKSIADAVEGFSRARTRGAVRALLRSNHPMPRQSDDLDSFYQWICHTLAKHHVTPTHSLDELRTLCGLLGQRQKLIMGRHSGTWMIRGSKRCWHTFYIARGPAATGNELALVLAQAMLEAARSGAEYLNLGICTEGQGELLNGGLIDFKEAIGGLAVNRVLVT